MPEYPLALDSDSIAEGATNSRERRLLMLAGAFLFVAQSGMILVRHGSLLDYWQWMVWVCCVSVGHTILRRRLPIRDPLIFPVVMLLSGWGVTLITRLAPDFAVRQ